MYIIKNFGNFNMNSITKSRRDFLKSILTVSVTNVAFPHLILGKIEPEIKYKGDKLLGLYIINIDGYPALKEMWGSVRIQIPPEFTDGYFAPIIVTHVPKEDYGKLFAELKKRAEEGLGSDYTIGYEPKLDINVDDPVLAYRPPYTGETWSPKGNGLSDVAETDGLSYKLRFRE